MIEFEQIMKLESDWISTELANCLREGFQIWNWWSEPIQQHDETRTFGFITLVKRGNLLLTDILESATQCPRSAYFGSKRLVEA